MTLIPPTGTVSLMLDCETTGIEPSYSFAGIKRFGEGGEARLHSPSFRQRWTDWATPATRRYDRSTRTSFGPPSAPARWHRPATSRWWRRSSRS